MVGCIMVRSFLYFCFAHLFTRKYHFHQAIAVDQIGQFYNAITPGASGGQIMQAYTYKKQGVPVSGAVSILAMYSIVYQVVLIFYGILTIILKWDLINEIGYIVINGTAINLWILISIGFFYNVATIGFILLLSYWDAFFKFLTSIVIYVPIGLPIAVSPSALIISTFVI